MSVRHKLRSLARMSAILVLLSLSTLAVAQATYKTIHEFRYKKGGQNPYAGVVADSAGNLYGTTFYGGTGPCQGTYGSGCGVVFELSPSSGGKWTETVLHDFTGGPDGGSPQGGVTLDALGNVYGMTPIGGTYNQGMVYKLTPADGGWTETVLYNFTGGADGAYPNVGNLVFDSEGNLYGTTWNGGNTNYCGSGCGVVFELSPGVNNTWTETVLYTFGGHPISRIPEAS